MPVDVSSVPDIAASKPRPRQRRTNAARLFGYDIFVSFALGPAPRGTHSYASDLARRLRERDFSVFFSEDEAPPGQHLDTTLQRALHRSKTLVVVLNRETLADPRWVRTEVEEFRRRHPQRPVIPINIDGALQDPALADDAERWLQSRDKIWLDETAQAALDGIASEALIERLATAPTNVRSNASWRWVVRGVVATLAVLAIGMAVAAKRATDSAERARTELRRAVGLRLIAEGQAMLTGARLEGDERALLELVAAHRISTNADVEGSLLNALVANRHLYKLIVTSSPEWSVDFSADGARVAAGGADGMLRVFDAATGFPVGAPIRAHDGIVRSVHFTPDNARILSSGDDGTLRMWDAATGKPTSFSVTGQPKFVRAALSPDGSRVVSTGGEREVRVWNTADGQALGALPTGHAGSVTSMAFSLDGGRLALGIGRDVVIIDTAAGKPVGATLSSPDCDATAVATGDGRRYVVSGGGGGGFAFVLCLWDVAFGKTPRVLSERHANRITSVAIDRSGFRIVSGSQDGTLQVWSLESGSPLGDPLRGHESGITDVAFSGDGRRIVSAGDDGTIRIWKAQTEDPLGEQVIGDKAPPIGRLELRRDANEFLSDDGRLDEGWEQREFLLDPHSGLPQGKPLTVVSPVRYLAFDPQRTRAAGALDSGVRVWDGRTGKRLADLSGHPTDASAVTFSPDGRRLATAASDHTLRIWDTATLQMIGAPIPTTATLSTLVFSPDGRRIASGAVDGTVRVWDAATGSPMTHPIRGHDALSEVRVVSYSRDGRYFLSASERTLRVWDATTALPIGAAITTEPDITLTAAFSPDSDDFVSVASRYHFQRVWPGPSRWADAICSRLVRNITADEWRQWVSPEINYVAPCPGLPAR